MRTTPTTDGHSHDALTVTANDHHPQPTTISINNTTQSLPPGTTYDLDLTLPHSNFKFAKIIIMGAWSPPGPAWRECAQVTVTTDSAEAIGTSIRDAGSFKKSYAATYSKQNGAANLSHKIFDSAVGSYSQRYIALKDAWITGTTLRLRFQNYFGDSATLWVKGQAEVY